MKQTTDTKIDRMDLAFSRRLRIATVARALPHALHQWAFRPFRKTDIARHIRDQVTLTEYRNSLRHDITSSVLFSGYTDITSRKVSTECGLSVVLFNALIHSFDDALDSDQSRTEMPRFHDILEMPSVSEVWRAFATSLAATSHNNQVLEYVESTFREDFDHYCHLIKRAKHVGDFATVRDIIHYDSGTVLLMIYQIIRIFCGHPFSRQCADQFYRMGIAGKYCDDIADLREDFGANNPNLFLAIAQENTEELSVLQGRLGRRQEADCSWLSGNCPKTYEAYFTYATEHYNLIHSAKLRLAVDAHLLLILSRHRSVRNRLPH
ncbi:hypothetical protein [Streptomyces sp. NPDC021212]|uniref:hypothetical protein n=1 Tax=Streptomyces sp. NPDC021212 TaxID=3365118 RepID=UPI0037AD43F6